MRTSLRLALLLAAAAGLAAPATAQQPARSLAPASADRPTLVVFLTVDQMRADYFPRFERQLSGGLGRLYRGGAFFEHGYQDHAITETAPGHSETMSGRFPRSTGVIFNAAGVQDPLAPLIGGGGPGASPFRFRGSTLTDWLRVADPRSRALSISRKDRGAILPIGRLPEAVFWYATDGRFTTSAYYRDTLPSWIDRFNARQLPQKLAGTSWTLLLPSNAYPEPDSAPVENEGRDFLFPHRVPAAPADAARLMTEYPFMDEITLQAALAGVEAMGLGNGPQTDVLAISLSTTDAVGHRYGPDSRELHDQILRLDRYVGAFLDSLYAMRDSSRIVVALTADHGVAPFPETYALAHHTVARYVDLAPVVTAARSRLAARGVESAAFRFEEGMIFLDRAAFTRARVNADSTLRAFAAAARRVSGVERVDLVAALASRDTTTDEIARRWLHMLPPDVPVGAVVTLAPYAYWAGVTHATHGSLHDYDANVPVLFYGPMIRPGRYDDAVRVVDIAPTLARIVGVPPLEHLDGHVLTRILR